MFKSITAAVFAVVIALPIRAQTTAEARKAYDTYLASLRAAVLAGDAEGVAALVTEDRVSVGATGHVTRGRAQQLSEDRAAFRGVTITSFEMHVTDFRSSGPMAYATGTGTHIVIDKSTGKETRDSFQYVEIMTRGADGRWRSQYFMNAAPERK